MASNPLRLFSEPRCAAHSGTRTVFAYVCGTTTLHIIRAPQRVTLQGHITMYDAPVGWYYASGFALLQINILYLLTSYI
jgi:hypothetical protein